LFDLRISLFDLVESRRARRPMVTSPFAGMTMTAGRHGFAADGLKSSRKHDCIAIAFSSEVHYNITSLVTKLVTSIRGSNALLA
jgi:hypothetical protein